MYNDNLTPYINRRAIKTVVSLFVGILILIFVALHGFLNVNGLKGGASFTHSSFNSELSATSGKSTSSFNMLSSGDYSVQIPMKNGGTYTKHVSVPYFFMSNSIDTKDKEPRLEVIGRGVMARLAQTPQGLTGWNESGQRQLVNQLSVDNSETEVSGSTFFPNLVSNFQINSRYIGGVSKSDDTYLPLFYDMTADDTVSYDAITSKELYSKAESTGFSLYNKSEGSISLYRLNKTKPTSVKLKETLSKYNDTPLFSTGTEKSVVVTGGDVSVINEDEDIKASDVNLKLSVISNKTGDSIKSKGFSKAQIQDVLLSPDGKYVFIKTNRSMAIYDTASLNLAFVAPYVVNQFLWVNSDAFTFSSTDEGMFIGSVSKQEAYTVAPYSLIRPTQISYVDGDSIYFTAYSSSNEGSKKPDAYKASIKDSQTAITRVSLKAFPYQGDGFYADLINGKVIVQLTKYVYSSGEIVSDEDKQKASEYILDNLGEVNIPTEYTYVVTDLRPQPTGGDE